MASSKHYGIVADICEGEPGSTTGSLSIAGIHADSLHSVESMVVVGSPTNSGVDLAQLVLTAEQAFRLGTFILSAAQDALDANRRVEELRKYGPAAARLCFALAEANANDVLVDQSRIRLGCPREAQLLAEQAYGDGRADGDWRAAWREAGERINAGKVV